MKIQNWISGNLVLFLAVLSPINECRHAPVVSTKTGKIQGMRKRSNEHCVDVYYGIPFATPPVGDLRFKRTVPVRKWDGILNATKKPPACPQVPVDSIGTDTESVQSEDCLYLNIWAPCSKEKKAVMVWIHGGGFITGSASMSVYDAWQIAALGDIVVVNTNYRLGILGFANSATEDAPGNAGMYDQAEALKWIQSNIENFGGNSSDITLAGESAGSMSVSIHATSPLTSKLFHRAIMESGSPLLLFIPLVGIINLNSTNAIAKAVGCTSLLPNFVMDCMRKKDAQTLLNASVPYIFGPQIDGNLLPEDPRLLAITGKSPISSRIIGVTEDEGSFFWISAYKDIYGASGEKVQHPTLKKSDARRMLEPVLTGLGVLPILSQLVIAHYMGKVQGDDNEEVVKQAYTAVGDVFILCPSVYEAEQVARHKNNVYFYQFSHMTPFTRTAEWMGVAHASEIPFLFGLPLGKDELTSEANFTEKEKDLSRRMIKMWTNFVKTGSPNYDEISWPLYSRQQPSYLILNTTERFEIGQGPNKDNCDFLRLMYGFL